jgi:hypothetical protein
MPDKIEYPQIEAELAALHREWHATQKQFLVRGPDGQLAEPASRGIARDILLMTGGIIATAFLSASPLPPWVAYLGLVPFAFGTYFLMTGSSRSEAYERAKTAYESRRHRLLTQLAAAAASRSQENSR